MILGIDLGQKTTGLAISSGQLSSPYKTITHKNLEQAVLSVSKIVDQEKVDKVIIGFVKGKIQTIFEDFAQKLKTQKPNLEVVMWDETLTSGQARESMLKQQVPKFKRSVKEHEMAAAIILQAYLDENV